jgi:hypothetical protein
MAVAENDQCRATVSYQALQAGRWFFQRQRHERRPQPEAGQRADYEASGIRKQQYNPVTGLGTERAKAGGKGANALGELGVRKCLDVVLQRRCFRALNRVAQHES